MQKKIMMLTLGCALSFMSQTALFAGTLQGTVKSVDAAAKKLEIDADNGLKWVAYTSKTKWPAGISDPSELQGKKVTVDQDDLLEEALSVAEV